MTAEPLDRWAHHDDYCPAIGAKGSCNCGLAEALNAARKASPPLDVEGVLWADHLATDHPTTPCYHDRAKVVMPGRVEAVAREYAALDPTP